MNFARVICDRRAAQSIMRNIAFALQARNHTRLFVSERVPIPPSDSVEICFESTIAKPDRSSRSARIVQRKINSGFGSAADIPALQHDRVVDGARKLDPLRSTTLASALPKATRRRPSGPKETIPSDLASRGISTFIPCGPPAINSKK
jgi:hypothetical protein